MTIWDEAAAERERAHKLHGASSMEELPMTDMVRLSVLMEEVGEVAKEFNEARHRTERLKADQRSLDQCDAMSGDNQCTLWMYHRSPHHEFALKQSDREQSLDLHALRKELVQVCAMAGAWADAIPTGEM